MFRFYKYATSTFALIIIYSAAYSQNISGKWEGIMGTEFIQLNIKQVDTMLCGNSYDIEILDQLSNCSAYFTGNYNKSKGLWTLNGLDFIKNSGNHILMSMRLWQPNLKDDKLLRGIVTSKIGQTSIISEDVSAPFWLYKRSNVVKKLKENMPTCFQEIVPLKKKLQEKKVINKEIKKSQKNTDKPNQEKIDETPPIIVEAHSAEQKAPIQTIKKNKPKEELQLTNEMSSRKQNTFSTLKVNVKKIQLTLYDNGVVDNDSVSIFYNGVLIQKNIRLTEAPVTLEVELDEDQQTHEITLFAENLGTLEPNTALVIIKAGKRRYELHSSASLNENAVIKIDYEP
jgi:hypothetical protein